METKNYDAFFIVLWRIDKKGERATIYLCRESWPLDFVIYKEYRKSACNNYLGFVTYAALPLKAMGKKCLTIIFDTDGNLKENFNKVLEELCEHDKNAA